MGLNLFGLVSCQDWHLYDRILKEFYLRWRTAGKKPFVAMTACMRKLVILMNRLLKNPNFQLAS